MTEKAPELTANEFNSFVKEGVVLIDFFADWCMPCMMMLPIVEDLADEFEGRAKIAKLNVSEYEDIAEKYNVNTIPNFTILKDGKIQEQFIGAMTLEELEEKVKKYL